MRCQFCREGGFYEDECKTYALDYACPECYELCPHCQDWMANEPETVIEGKRWHRTCAEEVNAPLTITLSPLAVLMLSEKLEGAA